MSFKDFRKNGGLWPMGIIAVLTIVVAGNAAFVTVALRHKTELGSKDYYAEGTNLKAISGPKAAGESTGWRVQGRLMPADQSGPALYELTVTESSGEPCDSLSGEVSFYRPSSRVLDIASLSARPAGPGRYLIVLPRPLERGAWQAVVHVQRGRQALDQRLGFFAE